MKKFSRFALSLSLILLSSLLVICSDSAAKGATEGIRICITAIVPTVFPFMTVSQLLSLSGVADKIGTITAKPFERLFRLPSCCFCAVLFGLVGGFPVGAKISAQLYRQGKISRTQLRRLLCFAVNAGPSFIVSTVGYAVLGSKKAGAMLLISCIGSCLTVGILSKFLFREPLGRPAKAPLSAQEGSLGRAITESSKAVLSMCCCIILFSAVLSICEDCGIIRAVSNAVSAICGIDPNTVTAAIYCITEVSSGCFRASGSIMLICWALGWSGISVHIQIFSMLSDIKISIAGFALARMICAVVGCIYFKLLTAVFPIDVEVFSGIKSGTAMTNGQLAVSLIFAVIMLASVFSAEERTSRKDKLLS